MLNNVTEFKSIIGRESFKCKPEEIVDNEIAIRISSLSLHSIEFADNLKTA